MAELAMSIALRTDFGLLIDGKLEQSDEHLDVINPALGEIFARCPAATRAHLERAVAAARAAFPAWRDKSFSERAALIKKMSQRLREKQQRARGAAHARARQTARAVGRRDRPRRRAVGRHGRHRDPDRGARGRQGQAHRAALPAARRRRDHHAVERAGEPRARPTRLCALHGQYGDPEAVAVHAALDAQARASCSARSFRPES